MIIVIVSAVRKFKTYSHFIMAAVMIERKGTQARYWYGKTWSRPSIHLLYLHINNNALCLPPKNLHNHCFQLYFSWVLQSSQEKAKTKVMQNFGGWTRSGAHQWAPDKVHYGLCENGELKKIPVQRRTHTAISRKVVGKSARDNPVRYCGWI